jgi:hypothetical protein
MRNQWTMTLCGVLLASALASAQPPPTEPTRPQDPTPVPAPKTPELQKPQPKPDEPAPAGRLTRSELKLTGCLQRGEDTAGADKASLAGGFVLRQATPTPSKDMKETGTPAGTKEYRLVAGDGSVKLADHVGHQVSITGHIALSAEPGATPTDKATSASRPSVGATALAPAVTVTVSSLKMVAPSCGTPAS